MIDSRNAAPLSLATLFTVLAITCFTLILFSGLLGPVLFPTDVFDGVTSVVVFGISGCVFNTFLAALCWTWFDERN